MPKRLLPLAAGLFVTAFLPSDLADAQAPPLRIAAMKMADPEGNTCGRRCGRPLVPRVDQEYFLVTVLENVTGANQPYSLGRSFDGSPISGGGSGSIDGMRRSMLTWNVPIYSSPGTHTVVVTLCTFESYPCGDGVNDDVMEQVTFEFRVR